MSNKEEIYDDKISPLMAQIIAICKENEISMVASFHVPNPDDADLMCTSALFGETWDTPQSFRKALGLIRNGDHYFMAMTITSEPKL